MKNNPFVPRKKTSVGVKSGCPYYLTREIYLKFVASGVDEKGETIGLMVPTLKDTKTDIQLLVNSHKDEVGVKNLIKLFNRTGDYSLFQARPTLPDGDYTGALEDPAEILAKLPKELVGDMTVEQFLKSLTPEQFKAWINSLQPAEEKAEEGVSE